MNRIDRISAILIQLQSRRVVKAQFIADRFDISLRTVYRDIRTLEEAGVPIIGEAGTGYSLADGYRLPPIAFTIEEATALFTAEKLVETLTDEVNSGSYQSAMFKVRAVLKNGEKDYLAGIDNRIEVLKGRRAPQMHEGVNPMQPVLKAIAEKKVLSLKYFSYYRQVHTERCVEPVGVFYLDRYWHLIGWCQMQQDYRDFRFDRMLDVQLTNNDVLKQHPALKTYIDNYYHERDVHRVVLKIDKKMALHLGDEKLYHGLVGEVDLGDEIEMTFLTGFLEGFARWFLFFADYATIVEPASLRTMAKDLVEKVLLKL
ncbi:helix-turn-helix transcriptional regulator [Mucilaginibacter aquatilis]|uniref:WYL domain-containing protein n=1 Tax=Mucilaginibacter aquatilis TaxID=1517760 RepID=A0A6I4IG02_9SPHI|nr:YafY family protein [Mucilaginibacter aquatilis]MVN92289.1 WYL domain-containing protein [Mucilaginibacter aquatilis]